MESRNKVEDKSDTGSIEEEVEPKCGYGKCAPKCLQPCATPGLLMFSLCTYALAESFVQWGLVNISLTTWERRYQMTSGQSVWIVTAKDIFAIFLAPVFGYMASYWHKGRMLTAGAICAVIGNVMFLIPQFATGPYQLGSDEIGGICDVYSNSTFDPCVESITDQNLQSWLACFIGAQAFFVVTSTAIWTVGITYVDDNCRHEDTALYMGILNSMGALGAVFGFIGGGLSLEVYVDVFKVDMDTIDIDSSDPRWVGAWWIGFLAALIFSFVPLLIIPCFPREVPLAIKWKKEKKSQAYKGRGDEKEKESTWAGIGESLKIIFSNPVYDLVTLGGILEIGAVTAFAAFLPKIIQFQFGQTTSMAALVAGAVLIPASVIGQLVGGFIPKYGKLSFKGILWMQVICAYICVGTSFGFLAKCDQAPLAGYTTSYPYNSSMVYEDQFTQTCNDQCNCTTLVFEPICAEDGMSYFNPCYASCTDEMELDDGTMMYGNCSCIASNGTMTSYEAEEGMCPVDCTKFWIFMPLLFIMIVCTFIESTGGYTTIMRCVPEKEKSFAFGMQAPLMKLLGTVPIPIIFGVIFDKSCDIWQDNCGEQGSCWIYDSASLSLGMFLAGAIIKTISGTCFLIAIFVYKPPPMEPLIVDEVDVDGQDKNYIDIIYGPEAKRIDPVDVTDKKMHDVKGNGVVQDGVDSGIIMKVAEINSARSSIRSIPEFVTKL